MQKILILINLAVVLIGAGLVYYSHNMLKPMPTDQSAETEEMKRDALEKLQIQAVPIKKFVVNLVSRESRLRYLDLEMNVMTFHNDQKEIIKANEHVFKDAVIEIASHLAPEDLDSVTGKILFEKKLKDRVNAKLGQPEQPIVKQIYFSGFVVQ